MKDYYAILGVRSNASAAEIKRVYRMLVIKYHPDRNPDPAAEMMIREINEAYDVLSDPENKYVYDQRRLRALEEMITEPVVKPHRDPRYRAPARPGKRQKPQQVILMEKMHSLSKAIIFISAVLVIMFIFDYVIPYRITEETISHVQSLRQRENRGVVYHLVTTASGKELKVYHDDNELPDEIILYSSRFYRLPMKIVSRTGHFEVRLGYMYRSQIFFPVLLLINTAFGVAFFRNAVRSFNYAIGIVLMIFLNWVIMY
jgi:DnaJ domain